MLVWRFKLDIRSLMQSFASISFDFVSRLAISMADSLA